jgi:hypothetical protein
MRKFMASPRALLPLMFKQAQFDDCHRPLGAVAGVANTCEELQAGPVHASNARHPQ